MNHLDVGYDGVLPEIGFINVILNKYFVEYFPRAAALGKALADGGYEETFRYTTHPWLVDLYLNCPQSLSLTGLQLKCPDTADISIFKDAVNKGYITWHANSMNLQTDNIDDWLLDFSLNIGTRLDKQFGIQRKLKVLSQRDVPGITHAVLPTLVKNNVLAVSVGVNPMTSPPALPKLFMWKYQNYSVMATWNPGGYPNNAGSSPKDPGGLSKSNCAYFDGFDEAMCFAFRTDNSGPPMNTKEIEYYYDILRTEFPGAKLQASSFEDFFVAVQSIASKLPVVDKEVGDTWIQGISSDPRKSSEYRAVSRVMKSCLGKGLCSYNDNRIINATRFLAKLPEHTWGLPGVYDYVNWTNTALTKALEAEDSRFLNCTKAWIEQRMFTYLTLDALGNHSVVSDIKEELEDTKVIRPDLTDYEAVSPEFWGKVHQCSNGIQLSFNAEGAVNHLKSDQIIWASDNYPLSKFVYVTYNLTDFDWFGDYYNYAKGISAGYYKENVTKNAHPESRVWPSMLNAFYAKQDGSCDFHLHVTMVENKAWQYYGAPQDVWLHYVVTQNGIDIRAQLFSKTRTRLPEALNLVFQPTPQPNYQWQLSKLGRLVDPLNVVLNGSQYLHGVDDNGLYYIDASGSGLQISSLDVPLAVVLTTDRKRPLVFGAPMAPIKTNITGFAYNIYNNVWDTNYIFWYPYLQEDEDFSGRFKVTFKNPKVNSRKWFDIHPSKKFDVL